MEKTLTLNNGVPIPHLGLGTWKVSDGTDVEQAVLWALEAGYRLIDTAKIYGNEEGVGRAIKKSGIPREELFITTKLWNADQGYESAHAAIDESMSKLGLDYVDLYLVHWPIPVWPVGELIQSVRPKRKESWKAMEEIYAAGKAKAIGVSNYAIKHLEEMREYATITPVVNQVEFHPFLYQKELLDYCASRNVIVQAYCPLIHGSRIGDDRITAISQKYGKSNAQILIRWSMQHGCIPLPKSTHQQRINENIDVFGFDIAEEDMAALDGLNENYRNNGIDTNQLP
jgi:diketogulonate reductase-like aldo/keto reductase